MRGRTDAVGAKVDGAEAGASIRFGILGPVEVTVAGHAVVIERRQWRALLAYLLLHAGRVVSADQLLEALWGGAPPSTARTQVQTAVSRIRRVVGEAGGGGHVVARASGYLVAVGEGQFDLDVFEDLTARARTAVAAGQPVAAAGLFRDGLRLWRGPALGGVAAAYVEAARARLEDRRLAVCQELADVELSLGRHDQVAVELGPLVDAHPVHERLTAQLMVALYRAGRQAEALAAFGRLRDALAEQLGIDPGARVRELHGAMLRADPALDPPQPARPPPAGVPAQLPAEVADFTGRAAEITALDALLRPDGDEEAPAVISVIAGTAGVGKTALAVHWAHRIAHRFGDGQLYTNLRGHAIGPPARPVEALAGFLRALGVPADRIPVNADEAAALYRSTLAGRRVLVVLDNAASARQVRPLLPGGAGCLALITSRHRLDGLVATHGARQLSLDVLTAAEANTLLERIIGEHRVAAEPRAATELAAACSRLPLALRIAAANFLAGRHRTIARYAAELAADTRLAMLEVIGDEQTAVRTAFDLSYTRLEPPDQRLFRLLGALPGSDITAEAAGPLIGEPVPVARHLLDRLAAAHLVEQHVPGRFTLHDLLRRYAADQARTDDEREAALARLFDWYLHAADAARTLLAPTRVVMLEIPGDGGAGFPSFDSVDAALAWLDAERPNLVAAVRHAATSGPSRVCLLLADAMHSYLHRRGHTIDGLAVATAALAAAESDGEPRGLAVAHLNLAGFRDVMGRHRQAAEHCVAARDLARRVGWLRCEALALSNLGKVCHDLGWLEQAAEHIGGSLALNRRLRDLTGELIALNNLAFTYHAMGRLDEALHHITEALTLDADTLDRAARANALATLAAINLDAGRIEEALGQARSALARIRQSRHRGAEIATSTVLADVHRQLGHRRQAIDLYECAVRLAQETGNRTQEAVALVGLATAHRQFGCAQDQALDLSLGHARRAVSIASQTSSRVAEGRALSAVAEIRLAQGDAPDAARHARRAIDIHRRTGYRLDEARALVTLGDAIRQTKGARAALPAWRRALALLVEIGSPDADRVRALLA